MKKSQIFVLVKNFTGINYDAEIYGSLKDTKKEFREYTGFRFNKHYSDPNGPKYNEKFSETKIYGLDLPDFLALKNDESCGANERDKKK